MVVVWFTSHPLIVDSLPILVTEIHTMVGPPDATNRNPPLQLPVLLLGGGLCPNERQRAFSAGVDRVSQGDWGRRDNDLRRQQR